MAEGSFSDEGVHICTNLTDTFDQVQGHEELFNKSKDAIGHVLRAFQVQFNDEIQSVGEQKRRAIYSVDVQFDHDGSNAYVLGFSFAPAENIDYDEAFKALFLDETEGLEQI